MSKKSAPSTTLSAFCSSAAALNSFLLQPFCNRGWSLPCMPCFPQPLFHSSLNCRDSFPLSSVSASPAPFSALLTARLPSPSVFAHHSINLPSPSLRIFTFPVPLASVSAQQWRSSFEAFIDTQDPSPKCYADFGYDPSTHFSQTSPNLFSTKHLLLFTQIVSPLLIVH
jgi:hypothetical protein